VTWLMDPSRVFPHRYRGGTPYYLFVCVCAGLCVCVFSAIFLPCLFCSFFCVFVCVCGGGGWLGGGGFCVAVGVFVLCGGDRRLSSL